MQETVSQGHVDRPGVRFIPAYAGNSHTQPLPNRRASVHPRAGGERTAPNSTRGHSCGSSPHVRGTALAIGGPDRDGRFIPACAGSSCFPPAYGTRDAVHPRMRGEQSARSSMMHSRTGSSPHARGTERLKAVRYGPVRFIPACARNSCGDTRLGRGCSVHPRMRGEQTRASWSERHFAGSSPHMRGTVGQDVDQIVLHRFIPACAGNSSRYARKAIAEPVHPRMRGEQMTRISSGR